MEQTAPPSSNAASLANRQSFRRTLRTTVAAAASLLAARACGLPEASWAVVTTIIVMQSTLGTAWQVSLQRAVGTLIGSIVAVALAGFFPSSPLLFLTGLLAMGLAFTFLTLQISAYRFAGITLAIIMLPAHDKPIWIIALHRFLEVNFGIIVGMAIVAIWPDHANDVAPLPSIGRGK